VPGDRVQAEQRGDHHESDHHRDGDVPVAVLRRRSTEAESGHQDRESGGEQPYEDTRQSDNAAEDPGHDPFGTEHHS